MTKRVKAIVEYDGSNYSGFQRQNGGIKTIQGEIEAALKEMSKKTVEVFASGRTDSGVHAIGQVIHFDIDQRFSTSEIKGATNHYLQGKKIALVEVEDVAEDFHARFDAVSRTYVYRIVTRQAPLVLDLGYAWHVKHDLDVEKMQSAAKLLEGTHDFNSFRSSICQSNSPIKTIDLIEISQSGDEIAIEITAKSFLHNMVRIIVSALKNIGDDTWSEDDLKKSLEAKDRTAGPSTAPSCGLYFLSVSY